MIKRFTSRAKSSVSLLRNNLKGWSSSRKIVVIESDDWGSIRMPSKMAFDQLVAAGIKVDKCPFLTYDTLETAEDFDALFNLLLSFRGADGKHPVITANYIMGNPDFERIAMNEFTRYEFKPFVRHLKDTGEDGAYFKTFGQGMQEGLIRPQLHGREHVNVPYWMSSLKDNSHETRLAFQHQVYGISTTVTSEKRRSYLPALDYASTGEMDQFVRPALTEARHLFAEVFNFQPTSFIAPNYVWDSQVEKVLSELGVLGIQSLRLQNLPVVHNGTARPVHHVGDRNALGQTYLVRNAIFEPSTSENKQLHLTECLKQIRFAFLLRKPAILSMHRINFSGGLHEYNRTDNLRIMETLLRTITNTWPDVVFMSSDQLVSEIAERRND